MTLVKESDAAPVVWDGPDIEFTKVNFSDWTLADNQDQITDDVWITRQNVAGIFNFKQEANYNNSSPADTEWATGSAADFASLTFTDWRTWHGGNSPSIIGVDAVLHLISEDIYIDIKFLSWTSGRGVGGGGFSYQRSTVPIPSTLLLLLTGIVGIFGIRRKKIGKS